MLSRKQNNMDYLRSNMPASLVDKSRIKGSDALHDHELPSAQVTSSALKGDDEREGVPLDDAEIDSLLDDVDDETALLAIRDARMQQLKMKHLNTHDHQPRVFRKPGEVAHLECAAVVPLVGAEHFAVLLLHGPHGQADEDSGSVLEAHLAPLAAESPATCFAVARLSGKEGDDLRHVLSVSALPAVVLFREGVIVRRVAGNVRQFVHMGPVGAAVFRAYLHDARVLCATQVSLAIPFNSMF